MPDGSEQRRVEEAGSVDRASSSPSTELPSLDHASRRERVRAALASATSPESLLLVTDPLSVRYLSGFTGSNGQVLLGGVGDEDHLITDARYERRAAVEAPDLPATVSRDAVGVALATVGDRRVVAVEAEHLTWAAARQLQDRAAAAEVTVLPTSGLVATARQVKDRGELARLARACAITQEALGWLVAEVVAVGRTERELATALERRFVDLGADGIAFPSIVAGGPNGAVPHHEPTGRPLRSGDLLTIDCGALVDGYHADHTRTVAVGDLAEVPAELRRVHELVVSAQAAGRDAVRAGVRAGDVDAAARQPIEDAGYGDRFVHGTGHGVGLQIHEAPAVAPGSAATLVDGMALTVEPGVYLPGLGGVRIEDTIVVTADGPARPLTDTPRGLRVPYPKDAPARHQPCGA